MTPPVVLRPDPEDGGSVASCPALPGCHSQGETVDEALANIREADTLCQQVLTDRRRESPR
jgi:predicted RNase H-like HicB family nuclease